MAEPGDQRAAAAVGRGLLRASHADREQAIEVLKDAFAQGRLDRGELDARVGQALASRTHAELAALTADIPADAAPRQPARVQNGASRSHPVRNGAIGVGVSLTVGAAAVLGAFVLNDHASAMLIVLAAMLVMVAVPLIVVATVAIAVDQRRSRGRLPPRPTQGGRVLDGQRDGALGRDPALPRDRADQTRADLRTHGSRAPRAMRPVPDAI